MKVLPHVFGAGPSICNATWIQRYAHRMCLPCGFTVMGDLSWDPTMGLESNLPLLWMRADQGISTGGARQFYSTDKTSLEHSDTAFFDVVDTNWYFGAWVYLDSTTGTIVSKDYESGSDRGYLIWVNAGTLTFFIGGRSASPLTIAGLVANRWYYVAAWYDSANHTRYLQLDNGTPVTDATAWSGAETDPIVFSLGVQHYTGATYNYLNGRLSRVSFLKNTAARAVIDSAATRTEMYNLGRGILSGNLDLLLADLGTFTAGTDWDAWNLNETDGTADARSFSGLNDLTPTFGELITNGGFETAGGGGADVFGSWTEYTEGTSVITDEGTIVDAGSHAAKLDEGASGSAVQVSQSILTVGHRYQYSLRARRDATACDLGIYAVTAQGTHTLTTSFASYSGTVTATNTSFVIDHRGQANAIAYIDTVSVTAVDIPAADGPSSDIAPDTGSVGTAHGQLIGYADSETARSTDVPAAIGSGTSLSLDGVDDYLSIPSVATGGTSFTMSMWVYLDGAPALNARLIAGAVGEGFLITSGKLNLRQAGDNLAATSIPTNAWVHLACSVSASNATFYLNGVADGTASGITAKTFTNISSSAAESPFKGKLDDVQIFSTALSAAQVLQLSQGTEATGATPVSMWTFDEPTSVSLTDGDPIATWTSLEGSRHQFIQATASKRPVYRASAINGQAGIDFDGVDDLLAKASAFLTGTSGTVVVVYRLDAVPDAYQCVFSSSDEATGGKYVVFYGRGNTANGHAGYAQNDGGTNDLLDGNTAVSADTDYSLTFGSNGSTITARLNGTAQTLNADTGGNNGDWFDDATGKDNVTVGAFKYSSEAQWMSGKIAEIQVWPHNFGAESISKEAAYMLARYGITF